LTRFRSACRGAWIVASWADPRFQSILWYLHPNPDLNILIAKSEEFRQTPRFGLPNRWRHELQSVEIVMRNGLADGVFDPDLLIYLIG